MRFLAVIIFLVFALAQPVAAQGFTPDFDVGYAAWRQKDYATALKHWRPLAEQGDGGAQFRLGWMYINGLGVAKDPKEADRLYRKAAEQGLAGAQHILGLMYARGWGVTKDHEEAVRWYRKLAGQGLSSAQAYLGYAYLNGDGVSQDLLMAYVWFNVAVTNGAGMARKIRDEVQKRLNQSDIKNAQKLSKLCLKKPASCPEYSDD
jgi:uncharacterized protein